ncbi:MAG: efflux RND transporter periplasmic adaptor subunit [Acidobacteria bacterium]|nr:efflux RND transporter periplasmic adaptor subunit [Acidobacteriota bacterium]
MKYFRNRGSSKIIVFAGIVLAISALVLFLSLHGRQSLKSSNFENQSDGPVASVVTVPLKRQDFHRTLRFYGSVSPLPETTKGITLTYQCRVLRLMAVPGQFVRKGDPLIQIAAGPAACLRLEQSKTRVTALGRELNMLTKKVKLKLATRQDLVRLKARVRQEKQELAVLRKQGIDTTSIIRADGIGIISAIDVSDGDVVPAGVRLLQVLRQDRMVVVFGVEIEERPMLKPGQTVRIHMVQGARDQMTTGRIQTISQAVNSSTRLIRATAVLDHPEALYLNAFVEVFAEIQHHSVLVVPVSAVLPAQQAFYLFTVVNHLAVRHDVRVVMKNESVAEVSGKDLRAGDRVVTLGNYELHDDMAVKEEVRL